MQIRWVLLTSVFVFVGLACEKTPVKVNNDPPILSNLSAPDTVSRSQIPNNFLLTIKVSDPQGLEDIDKVYFNTFKPDDSPSSGNPFYMRDDGLQGVDQNANDGIYSLRIEISPQNQLGNYRFEFEAIDKSGAKSNKIIHIITVVE
ncbi:hypothetical protein DRQ00_05185 [candidate division KSB1 bacterium]|nr:MAG: hypothetical protein DRQ00_05185 [candidate division KSB1 bacterium]